MAKCLITRLNWSPPVGWHKVWGVELVVMIHGAVEQWSCGAGGEFAIIKQFLAQNIGWIGFVIIISVGRETLKWK